jgi:hypothetical protein
MRLALKKNWRASLGTLPFNNKLTNFVREEVRGSATRPREGEMRSFKICKYMPSWPHAELVGKAYTALVKIWELTVRGVVLGR